VDRVSPPPPAVTEDLGSTRLALRDGLVTSLRVANKGDRDALRRFFHDLSPESRQRFLGSGEPTEALIHRFCDSSDPKKALTLLAYSGLPAAPQIIGAASYFALTDAAAEAALTVADPFHGKGVGTAILERLAAIASTHAFRWFQATTLADNDAMLEVFRDSGFEIRSKSADGCVDVRLSLAPSDWSAAAAERRDHRATVASLRPGLSPRSVAIIGASRSPSHLSRRILDSIVKEGFGGPIYPINPFTTEIGGLRCYRAVRDIPTEVDLAIVAVPPQRVLAVVEECGAAGVKALAVITAGFAELGPAGRALQDQLVEKVRAFGMRLVGPNCMGVLNTDPEVRLNASFAEHLPQAGRVTLASQSGGLDLAILGLAAEREMGLSTFVSLGNKADVSGNDLLQYGEEDPRTSVILQYLESFGNPRRFARLARRIGRTKPIVVVKAGRTTAGTRAAGSHTAKLAASETAVEALFRQSGVIRADTIDEMFDIAACLDTQPLPSGSRVAIITNAGGPGILAVDACEAAHLVVSEFSEVIRARLAECLPPAASPGNPIDMVASAGATEYRRAVEVALTAEEIDAVVVIYTPIDATRSGDILSAIADGVTAGRRAGAANKPVLGCIMATAGRPAPLHAGNEIIPAYVFPENAVRALGKVADYARWRTEPPGLLWAFDDTHTEEARTLCQQIVEARGSAWLTGDEVRQVLHALGLPLAAGTVARTAEDAAALARVLGFPVAAKLSSPHVQHKSDIGGVQLNLMSDQAVRTAFEGIVRRAREHGVSVDGVLVQPMVAGGVETMIGVTQDRLFGPLVAFGMGGIHVEVSRDVAFRIAPLTDRDVDELLRSIRGFPLLQGYRGQPPADLDALRETLLRVSRLAENVPEIVELDFNPVVALPYGQGCRIVDARIRVGSTGCTP
jgi:acetyl coenzyme A synthetase (ADP forming)-like protein